MFVCCREDRRDQGDDPQRCDWFVGVIVDKPVCADVPIELSPRDVNVWEKGCELRSQPFFLPLRHGQRLLFKWKQEGDGETLLLQGVRGVLCCEVCGTTLNICLCTSYVQRV